VISLLELPDGDLMSGGRDGTVRRWRNGLPLGDSFPADQGAINALLLTPDGMVISAGGQGSLRWLYPPRRAIALACQELAGHAVLLHPTTEVEREARQTCLHYGALARPSL
jgi:hypothetical protein